MITFCYSFVRENHFFVEKYDKKMAKIGTIFLNFSKFFVFFCFQLSFFACYDLPIVLRASGYPFG